MKILIYTLQSSGATLFSYLMSQRENSIGILDLYNTELSPSINHNKFDIILKCTVSENYSLEQHIKSFLPDKVILFKRNESDIIKSLSKKPHANLGGNIQKKFEIFNSEVNKNSKKSFNLEYSYEEMINGNISKLKFFIDSSAYNATRTIENIIDFSNKNCSWCKENFKKKWWIGCINPRQGSIKILKNKFI